MNKSTGNRKGLAALLAIGVAPFLLNGFYNPLLIERPGVFWALDVAAWTAIPVAVYLIGVKRRLFTREELGFHLDIRGKDKAAPFFIGIIALPFVLFWLGGQSSEIAWLIWGEGCGERCFSYRTMLDKMEWGRTVALVYMSISAGVVEEFYYRGALKLLFGPGWMNGLLYVLTSSLLFASVHWEGGVCKLFFTFLFGLAMAVAYLKIRNLWPLVFSHTVVDLFYLG